MRTTCKHYFRFWRQENTLLFWTCSCNWVGVHEVVQAMTWYGASTLANTPMTNITVSGKVAAAVQNVDNFSFA